MKPLPTPRKGVALIITLAVLVIVTILAVGFVAVMRLERASARNNFESLQARSFAEMAADHAIGLIREATENGSANGKFWSSQPGKITVFNASDGSVDTSSSRILYTTSTNVGATTVDLNQISFGGRYPIASGQSVGGSAPQMAVQWNNVLETPSAAASATNKVVGRYAFWVDDETAKINVNTANGTDKSTPDSYGSGTPADVSLEVLREGASAISATLAKAIASRTRIHYDPAVSEPRQFNSPGELLQLPGAATSLYDDNNFAVTHYNRSPELNFFGEPKIYLATVRTGTSDGIIYNAALGDYDYKGVGVPPGEPKGLPLAQVYPASSQLPKFDKTNAPLPQTFTFQRGLDNQNFKAGDTDYDLGYRICQYLKGFDSQGNALAWPVFPGAGSNGFAGKYTDRQIDSIALQILSLMKRGTFGDQYRATTLPMVLGKGWLSGKPVRGLARGPRLTEIVVEFTAAPFSPKPGIEAAQISIRIDAEWYFPKEYKGYPLADPYENGGAGLFRFGAESTNSHLNYMDVPLEKNSGTGTWEIKEAPLGGYWMDNLLVIQDQNDTPAGVDLFGNPKNSPDPDQVKAAAYHPWTLQTTGSNAGKYMGAGPLSGSPASPFKMCWNLVNSTANPLWGLGEYHCQTNQYSTSFYPSKPGVTEFRISGGLTVWATRGTGPDKGYNIEPVPLDSIRGPFYTGESISDIKGELLQAVIPMPKGLVVPVPGSVTVHFQVADPWVNSMPGDWIAKVGGSEITMTRPSPPATVGAAPTYYKDETGGRNTASQASNGADPLSIWWPQQDATIPKNQRFPSAGYLQYIRTGMMPDKTYDSKPLAEQKGTPFRMLNFAPSTHSSQKTDGGVSYPDWAMLDLFTVPATLQPLGSPAPPYVNLTFDGATSGRVNPNPPVLPTGSIARTRPMEGLLKGQEVSTEKSDNPGTTSVDEAAIAAAIHQYISGLNRPLMMPGEICNVPEVADFLYKGVDASAQSRNDLVRRVVGNTTTRSNTFTVWAVGQTVKKKPSNTNYNQVEASDFIVGESRMQFLVERYLDKGTGSGVPPTMTYPLPHKYRVVFMKELTN